MAARYGTLGWMRVEPQQRNAHPTEDHCGNMNPRDFSRGESQGSRVLDVLVLPRHAPLRMR